jgi:hypothetical protein
MFLSIVFVLNTILGPATFHIAAPYPDEASCEAAKLTTLFKSDLPVIEVSAACVKDVK